MFQIVSLPAPGQFCPQISRLEYCINIGGNFRILKQQGFPPRVCLSQKLHLNWFFLTCTGSQLRSGQPINFGIIPTNDFPSTG